MTLECKVNFSHVKTSLHSCDKPYVHDDYVSVFSVDSHSWCIISLCLIIFDYVILIWGAPPKDSHILMCMDILPHMAKGTLKV